jgi:hypothetical protein
LWTNGQQLREFVAHVCESVGHGHPDRIGINLRWSPTWLPAGAGRKSAVTIGAGQWSFLPGAARAAALIVALTRDDAHRSDFLVRATTSSLDEWLKFCNFDVRRLTGTWQTGVSYTATLAGGAGVDDIAFSRINSAFAASLLGLLGYIPASIRTSIGLADLRLRQAALIKGIQRSSKTVGSSATITWAFAGGQASALDTAMQRHVLNGGKNPLDESASISAEYLPSTDRLVTAADIAQLRADVSQDDYLLRFVLALPLTNVPTQRALSTAASDLPVDELPQLNKELVDRYRSRR